ncbi:phosphonate C-P lyase system protein PhnH [Chloroflexus sp.]|uniref:phosphonate C-P lyase system protein PhnH n=1 Tax=Chloroflexus sp. TaxID=1904827 RepID=UPI00298ED1D4|nr:phosphonate C-P lyase system protein PhnH [Chloroflexus sp.]MDW8403014.1 phosphonate C-P lyase system protein PhnH [Chloroflexus sp.]
MTIVAATPTPLERFNGLAFRVLLDCLARPGKVGQLPPPPVADLPLLPDGTPPNAVAVAACLSLLDQTTSFAHAAGEEWLAGDHPLTRWIELRTNARPVAPAAADFALLHDPAGTVLLATLNAGDLLTPERSCTVFICVPEIVPNGATLRLCGPGIASETTVGLGGVAPTELAAIAARPSQFPLGIDIFLIDQQGRCVGLPRTTQIT